MHGVPPGSPANPPPLRISIWAKTSASAAHIDQLLSAAGKRALILEPCIGSDTGSASALEPPAIDLAVIVADAAEGLTQEARRHAAVARAAGARHVVLVLDGLSHAQDQHALQSTAKELSALAAGLEFASALATPVSSSTAETLLAHFERVASDATEARRPLRLLIEAPHLRGRILSGTLRQGQGIKDALSEAGDIVERILVEGAQREGASTGETVVIDVAGDLTAGPGDMLVELSRPPHVAEQFAARLAWLGEEPLLPSRDYLLRMNGREVSATVTAIKYRLDADTLGHEPARTLERGEVGAATIATAVPLTLDAFADLPQTARFALYDRFGHALVAAGTVDFVLRRGVNVHMQPLAVSKTRRAALKAQGPCVLWFTGLSGAGKSTIANLVEGQLALRGSHTYLLDGDNLRHGLNKNLGFTAADRVENIRRVGEVAKLFVDAGLIVLCSFISPFRAERAAVRDLVEPDEFIEIFVRAPLDVCERRDPKGLYAKSRAGELPNFTGIDSPYEEPESPDLVLDTTSAPATELARRVIALLETRRMIAVAGPKSG